MSIATPPDLQAGTKAPDFTLPSTSGQPVTLSSFAAGKNILLDKAGTLRREHVESDPGHPRDNAGLPARTRSL